MYDTVLIDWLIDWLIKNYTLLKLEIEALINGFPRIRGGVGDGSKAVHYVKIPNMYGKSRGGLRKCNIWVVDFDYIYIYHTFELQVRVTFCSVFRLYVIMSNKKTGDISLVTRVASKNL